MPRCVVLSQGPPPIAGQTRVEGGGLRCWGLATGLRANAPDWEVVLAYDSGYGPPLHDVDTTSGVRLATWHIPGLPRLLEDADSVVVSYCMGQLSGTVAEVVRPDQQLVLDCYVPVHVEVSARHSADVADEHVRFTEELPRWSRVLQRGDVFLCAGEAQREYYRGVLAGLGRINPLTYEQELILDVPYGIPRDRPEARTHPFRDSVGDGVAKLLWFGGSYPWFDARRLVEAMPVVNRSLACHLFIVGARNPFVIEPAFIRWYDELVRHIESCGARGLVTLHDWIRFEDRADYYCDSDLVTLINSDAGEASLAWRTRLADYVWAGVPIASNGGDPLSEQLLRAGAAARLEASSAESLAAGIVATLRDDALRRSLAAACATVRETLHWDTVTRPLAAAVTSRRRAADIAASTTAATPAAQDRVLRHALRSATLTVHRNTGRARAVGRFFRDYGARETARLVLDAASARTGHPRVAETQRLVFLSHMLDRSGAPLIAMEMAMEARRRFPWLAVVVYTHPPVDAGRLEALRRAGIPCNVLPSLDDVPYLSARDVLVVNTAAHDRSVKLELLSRLERGAIRTLIWYIHEDYPSRWFDEDVRQRMTAQLEASSLLVLVAGQQLRRRYVEFFGTESNVRLQPYRITIPDAIAGARSAEDFATLRFILPGRMVDGRKGQLAVFYALAAVKRQLSGVATERHRDFRLLLLGLEGDFLSEQVRRHRSALGDSVELHETVSRDDALSAIASCNVTICYSISESLPIFVFEGMLAGHPVLRNDCSGVDEQLAPGENGVLLPNDDFWGLVTVFETLLDRQATPDHRLAAMSRRSVEMARAHQAQSYFDALGGAFEELLHDRSAGPWRWPALA